MINKNGANGGMRGYDGLGDFPPTGSPNRIYMDATTNILYRWNPDTGLYEPIGDGREWQYVNRAAFPAIGLEFHNYIDLSSGAQYYWDGGTQTYRVVGGGDTPIGSIVALFGTTAPSGWFICDGRAFDIVAYPFLHQYLSSNYPNYISGQVPDLRDMYLRHVSTGRAIGHYQGDMITQHSHNSGSNDGFSVFANSSTVIGNSHGWYKGNNNQGSQFGTDAGIRVRIGNVTNATAGNEVRTKNIGTTFIIKAVNGHADAQPSEREVFFFANVPSFPATGVADKIYVDKSANIQYYWDGAYYALGSTGDGLPTVIDVTTTPYNYTIGDYLHIKVANAVINIPAMPRGKRVRICNDATATDTIINGNINGQASFNELHAPFDAIEIISVGTELRAF